MDRHGHAVDAGFRANTGGAEGSVGTGDNSRERSWCGALARGVERAVAVALAREGVASCFDGKKPGKTDGDGECLCQRRHGDLTNLA